MSRRWLILPIAIAVGLLAFAALGLAESGGDDARAPSLAVFEIPAAIPADGALPPALILMAGALLVGFLPRVLRSTIAVAAPSFALFYLLTQLESGMTLQLAYMDMELTPLRVDRLSRIFGMIFSVVGIIGGIYAFHIEDRRQQIASMLYNAGALGVVFAGDYFTLYAFWELMAIASTVLIWARDREDSQAAGKRYVLVHLAGGSILLAGMILHYGATGSLAFTHFAPGHGGLAAWLILLGFAVNAAIPPLGPWLPDSYPRATVTGAIFLSALTTKTAVYVLIRGFYGWEILVPLGVIMALYGVVYAVLANDVRELLAYHIISQVGYMVAGIGLGTTLAVNGAIAHAVCHILYKSVLFMGAGAVIATTGREQLAELGGFVRRQKLVFALYMIGAFSISGFPLFNGFISKSMVTAAAHELHSNWVFLGLMLASVGTFLHTGLKLPYNVWFGEDKGIEPLRTPVNMIVALAIAGGLCVLLGVRPGLLYAHLPFEVHWEPYTAAHLVEMIQLLLFTFFAFYLFIPKLGGSWTIAMDTDVFYRKPARFMRRVFVESVGAFFDATQRVAWTWSQRAMLALTNPSDWIPGGLERIPEDEPGYDADRNRRPLGVSLALTLIVFVVVAVVSLRAAVG